MVKIQNCKRSRKREVEKRPNSNYKKLMRD